MAAPAAEGRPVTDGTGYRLPVNGNPTSSGRCGQLAAVVVAAAAATLANTR